MISGSFYLAVSPGNIFTVPDANINATIGDTVIFQCGALGGPDNVYSWTRLSDGTVVANQTVLTITADNAYDGSIYQCRVENAAGNVSKSITLYG